MGSKGIASLNDPAGRSKPSRRALPTPFVREFRLRLAEAMRTKVLGSGETLGNCIGIYCFFDYDGEPIYVGQTTEKFSIRVARHLTGQRSDTVAYRILDPFEVASMALWPMTFPDSATKVERQLEVDAAEYAVYRQAIFKSEFGAILNEKLPPRTNHSVSLGEPFRFELVDPDLRDEREHPDVRIARRAETLARLAAVAHERGEVSDGLRRVIVIQAIRVAYLAARRLAFAEGRPSPPPEAINMTALVGQLLLDGDREETDMEDDEIESAGDSAGAPGSQD